MIPLAMNSCGVLEPMLRVSKMKLLEFLAKIHGTNPKSFPSPVRGGFEEMRKSEPEPRIEAAAGTSAMASASSVVSPTPY